MTCLTLIDDMMDMLSAIMSKPSNLNDEGKSVFSASDKVKASDLCDKYEKIWIKLKNMEEKSKEHGSLGDEWLMKICYKEKALRECDIYNEATYEKALLLRAKWII